MSRFTKRAGTEGQGQLVFVKPADLARAGFTGTVAEGQFVEALPNKFDEDKHDFKILADVELEIEGVDKNGKKYKQTINSGDILIVNGAGNLNYKMKSVGPGQLCQINYLGKSEITSGERKGTQSHAFDVLYE